MRDRKRIGAKYFLGLGLKIRVAREILALQILVLFNQVLGMGTLVL